MPLDPTWADVAKILPDARALQSKNEKKHKLLGWMEECFCVNCGRSGGMISKLWAAYVFFLCDLCVGVYGQVPLTAVPDDWARDPTTDPDHPPVQSNERLG